MQKITFRKLAGEKYIYPELQGHFIEFLGSCIYDGIWVGEDSEIPNYHGIRKDLVDALRMCITGGMVLARGSSGRLHTMKTSVLSRRIPISSVHTR